MDKLAGKRSLVTGGTTGLGLAIAGRFLAEGAHAVITGRDRELGGNAPYSGDGGLAPAAGIDPVAMAADGHGNVLVTAATTACAWRRGQARSTARK
jgi:NAD(P)-dependent dehydrogenase (short-subunit alcohol dehydrogenase family)